MYRDVAQGVRCENLRNAVRDAELKVKSWEEHVRVLKEKISIENSLLDSLRNQAERTGDHDSFIPDIRQKEDKIQNLERQLVTAEDNVVQWQNDVARLENEIGQNGCFGSV
jgi:chromosome segregation ATPase